MDGIIENDKIIKKERSFKSFRKVFDPKVETQLTREVSSSPVLNEQGVMSKFDITMEGEDEFRTRKFPYEEGELYMASFNGNPFPYISKFRLPETIDGKLAVIMGFSMKLKDQNVPKGALLFSPEKGINFWFEAVMGKNGVYLKPVSFSISSKGSSKIGEDIIAWVSSHGSKFPEWYIREKLPEIF